MRNYCLTSSKERGGDLILNIDLLTIGWNFKAQV